YLEGWAKGMSTRGNIVSGEGNIQTVLQEMTVSSEAAKKDRLSSRLFSQLLTSYSCFLVLPESNPTDRDNSEARVLKDNLEGFQQGATSATDDLFKAAYILGYNAGYERGFSDGYVAGFAEARQAGATDGPVKLAIKLSAAIDQG